VKRRQAIATFGGIAGTALAGCMGSGPGNDGEGDQSPDDGNDTTTTAANETGAGNETGGGNETDATDVSGEVGDNIPENVEVVRHDVFEKDNEVGVTGLVENTGDQAFEELEVEVTLQDGDTVIGEFVDTKEKEAGSLAAGAAWQFVVTFGDENLNKATGYKIEMSGELADGGLGGDNETGNETQNGTGNDSDPDVLTGEVGSVADNLQVTQQNMFQSDDRVGVAGTVENTGDRGFEEVEVEVTLRDGDTVVGEFVDTNEKQTETLAAGAAWQFVVFFKDETLNKATGYTIDVDGGLV
jgi:hypothetical protein